MKYLYMKTTKDKYELPEAVAESVDELAKKIGYTKSSVATQISKHKKGFYKILIDEEGD